MKRTKLLKLLSVTVVILAAVSFARSETLLGSWDMNGTPVTKTVDSIISNDGWPSGGFVEEERTAIEDPDGDVVFGWPKEGLRGGSSASIPEQSVDGGGASGQSGDKSLLIKGALYQSAHIGEAMRPIVGAFKVSLDFKLYEPEVWDSEGATIAIISGGLNRFEVRIVRGPNGGAQAIAYCWLKEGGASNVPSDFTIDVNGWNNLEFWLQNGTMNIKINDGTVNTAALGGTLNTVSADTYDGLTIGARWDGNGRWARAWIDNVELYELVDGCGSWGYLPTDFNEDCFVDIDDLAVLANEWLMCTDPQGQGCVNELQ